LLGPVYRRPLCVLRRAEAQLNRGLSLDHRDWDQVDTFELVAIESYGINLVRGVRAAHPTLARLAKAHEVCADHVAVEACPLALHANNATSEIKCDVVAHVFRYGLQDFDT